MNGDRWRVWNKEHIHAGPVNGDYPRAVPDGVHTFGHFISAKEFAAAHPEYFSMDAADKRMTDDMGNKQLWIQLCVTNPDVRRITLERAKQMLRDDEALAENVVVRSTNQRLIAERSTTIPGRTAARSEQRLHRSQPCSDLRGSSRSRQTPSAPQDRACSAAGRIVGH